MPLILAAAKRAGKRSRGTPRLRQVLGFRWRSARCSNESWAGAAFCVPPRRDCGGEPLRRQGRRRRMFGLAGFKPALIKTRASVASASQLRAAAAHRRACAALTNTMHSAVCAVDAAPTDFADTALWCALTFELSGRRRQDARPGLAKMYRVPPDRAWWPAVGAPLERGVRHHRAST